MVVPAKINSGNKERNLIDEIKLGTITLFKLFTVQQLNNGKRGTSCNRMTVVGVREGLPVLQ
jgi:hypothetical protein